MEIQSALQAFNAGLSLGVVIGVGIGVVAYVAWRMWTDR